MNPLNRRQFNRFALSSLGMATLGTTSLGLPLLANSQQREPGIAGQQAPELAVPFWIDGKGEQQPAFSIAAQEGKWVVLKCFQDWCPGCHRSGFPSIVQLTKAFPDNKQLAVAAIQTTFEGFYTNTVDALRKNQLRYELDIPFGHDAGEEQAEHGSRERYPSTMLSYRTGGTPWIVVIDPQGRVLFNHFHVNTDKLIEFLKARIA